MAKVIPPLSCIRPTSAGEYSELAVLESLSVGLSDAYTLFHSVDWATAHANHDKHGELDIVVVNGGGDVALLEIKAGTLAVGEVGIFKRYGGENKDIVRQSETQFGAVLHRLRSTGLGARIMHFLVLPDQLVGEQSGISYPRERIADASETQDLPGFIQRRLGQGLPDPLRDRVCAFFENRLALQTDVSILAGRLHAQVAKISGGLASWVPRIESPSGVIRICATAGSGKTQLALRLLREARVANQQAAYICFNRPLADHFRDIAPTGVQVQSFHQLCWQAAGKPPGTPNFPELVDRYLREQEARLPDLDLLVIDEFQDFHAAWVQALLGRLRPNSKLYLLDDPMQCLYVDRDEINIADAVVVRSQENFRSPQRIVETINSLQLTADPIQSCSPFEGDIPGLHVFKPTGGGLLRATLKAIQACIDKGFSPHDIVVLCWRGREHSALMNETQLGDWRTLRFDGTYDERGAPNWSDGELRLETVRRFKGQSAPAIVLTEIDFEEMGQLERNLLFVALTRASMHLELVMSESSEGVLMRQISGAEATTSA